MGEGKGDGKLADLKSPFMLSGELLDIDVVFLNKIKIEVSVAKNLINAKL